MAALAIACDRHSPSGPATCGNGVVDAGEACDDGAANGTTGCTAACAFACVTPEADCDAPPPCQTAACASDHTCTFVADASQDGTPCGAGMACNSGSCAPGGTCGDGMLDAAEACDFGVGGNGRNLGCEDNCTLSCSSDTACDDAEPCNGVERCELVTVSGQTGKRCVAGPPPADGASCGPGALCLNATCVLSVCGDGATTSPEECDDANPATGDGCEPTCRYSCVSTDATRNCTPADACKGQGTCNDATHTCTPGSPLADDSPCNGGAGYCKTSVCTTPVCPNGDPEPGETCDDGNTSNGDGCDSDCTYSCVDPSTDCGAPPACQMWTCTTGHVCQATADLSKNSMSCGTAGQTCQNGACTSGVCGNGVTEAGEQCDFGSAKNGPNTGCETDCTLSCSLASDCDDGNSCNGAEACSSVTVSGKQGKRCVAGTPPPDNTICGTNKICKLQACVSSVCGDGYVDASRGETCEPPNTTTCDATCTAPVCGNGARSLDEQCDDGNLTNLDGCNATCRFEQIHRINDLDIQFGTSSYCPANALGGAAGAIAQGLVADSFATGVTDGSISLVFQLLGLDDLSGTSDPSISVGVVGGDPVAGTTTYNGNNDLDWWYTIDLTDLTATRLPARTLSGSIAAKQLTTSPGSIAVTTNFAGVPIRMDMFNTKLRASIGAASAPLVSSSGGPPGHLASEHLAPTLTSFATMGTSTVPGELCGPTTSRSLANTSLPPAVLSNCTQYTADHSVLDVFVGGCTVLIYTVVKPTQPDVSKTANVTYTFQTNAQRYVTSCSKFVSGVKQNPGPTLTECLDNSGYTTYFKFTTDRVIGK